MGMFSNGVSRDITGSRFPFRFTTFCGSDLPYIVHCVLYLSVFRIYSQLHGVKNIYVLYAVYIRNGGTLQFNSCLVQQHHQLWNTVKRNVQKHLDVIVWYRMLCTLWCSRGWNSYAYIYRGAISLAFLEISHTFSRKERNTVNSHCRKFISHAWIPVSWSTPIVYQSELQLHKHK